MKIWTRRRIQAELAVIGALTEGELPGFTLYERTGLGPGRLHVALARLEGAGRIKSCWQDGPYPRRRLYRLAEDRKGCDCGHEGLHAMFHLAPCPVALLRRRARALGYDLALIPREDT